MPHKQGLGSFSREKFDDFILHEPIGPLTLKLFTPLALSLMISSTVGIVDMYLASDLGSAAQAAVGFADQLIFLLIVFGTGLSTASSSFVSRSLGAGDFGSCKRYAICSLFIAFIFGIIASLLGIYFAGPALEILGCAAELKQMSRSYVAFSSFANAPFVLSLCLSSIYRALGRPYSSVRLWLLAALLSNCISAALFFCAPVELRSLDLLAIGWDIGITVSCLYGIFLFLPMARELTAAQGNVSQSSLSILESLRSSKQLLLLAAPAVLGELSLLISQFFIYRFLSGTEQSASLQAAWTIKIKMEETLALMPLMALGMSTGVIVGQSLGAANFARALGAVKLISYSSILSFLVLGTVLSAASPVVASFFAHDQISRIAIVSFLLPSLFLYPLSAATYILLSAMEGAGQTFVPMLLNLLFLVGARILFSYIFCAGDNANASGIAWGQCLAQLLMLLACLYYYQFFFARKLRSVMTYDFCVSKMPAHGA